MGLDGCCQHGVHQRLQGQQLPALQPQAHPAEQTCTKAGPNGNRQGGAPGKAAVGQVRPGGPEGGGHDRQGAGGKGLVRLQPRQQEHGGEHQPPANTQQTRQQPSQQPQGEIGQQAPQHPGNLG